MNYQVKILTATALPILLSIGCVSTNQKLSMTEPQAEDVEQTTESIHEQAIANMDNYLKQLNADEKTDSDSFNQSDNVETVILSENTATTVKAEEIENTDEKENTFIISEFNPHSINEEVEIITPEAGTMQVSDNAVVVEDKPLLAENSNTKKDTTLIYSSLIINDDNENTAKITFNEPEKKIFHFSFNKNQPFYEDLTILNEHAQYLIQNPNMILNITGHSDKRGNWNYNLRLSELRAKNIATILVAAGVNESQVRVEGMSDSIPLVLAENWSENRRVELTYQASVVASTK